MDWCRVIVRYGIGIDVAAATKHGIPVTNVPAYCLEEVATHALTLLLALNRGIVTYDSSIADGEWNRDVSAPIHRFSSQMVGIVGYGSIGRETRRTRRGRRRERPVPVSDEPATLVPFEELLETADFVSIHSLLVENTRNMIDDNALARMKSSAYFVNISRSPIVDDEALF